MGQQQDSLVVSACRPWKPRRQLDTQASTAEAWTTHALRPPCARHPAAVPSAERCTPGRGAL